MALTALGNLALPASAFLLAPVLARALGVAGRGQLAAATAVALLAVTLVSCGLPEAATYFVASRRGGAREVLRRVLVLLLVTGAAGTVLLLLLAPLLDDGSPELRRLLHLAAASVLPTALVGGLRAVAAGQGRWALVNAEKYLTAGVRLGGAAALALAGDLTLTGAAVVLLGAPLLGGLVYLRLRPSRTTEARVTGGVGWTGLSRYGGTTYVGAVAGVLVTRLDQVLVGPLAGAVQLGLYAAAVSVAEVVLIGNHAVRDVTLAADATDSVDARLQQSARLSTAVSAALALPIGLTAPLWVPLLFGRDFAGAVPVVLVLLVAAVLWVPGSVAAAGLSARGHPWLRSLALVVGLVVDVAVVLLLVPTQGALGAAVATLVANVAAAACALVMLRRRHGLRTAAFYGLRREDLRVLQAVVCRLLP